MKHGALSRVIATVVVISVTLAAVEMTRRVRQGDLNVEGVWMVSAAMTLGVGYCALAWGFVRLVRREVSGVPAAPCVELYFRSLLARYLPGKVGIPAVRMAGASGLGVSAVFMATGVVLESLAWLATGGVVSMALALGPGAGPRLTQLASSPATGVLIGAVLSGVLVLALVDSTRYPAWLLRRLKIQRREGPLLPVELLVANAVLWLATGASCAAVARALGADGSTLWLAATLGVFAPLVGFLALPVPAGLGVREAVLVLALSPELGTSRAIGLGVMTRAVALATELVLWSLSRAWLAARAG